MNVCVDKAGQNSCITKIENFGFWWDSIERYYLPNHLSLHKHGGRDEFPQGL